MQGLTRRFPFYPILISLWSPLALLAANLEQLAPSQVLRTLLGSVLVALSLLFVAWLVMRALDDAAWIVALLLVLGLSYGHAAGLLAETQLGPVPLGQPAVLLPVGAILAGLAVFALRRWPDLARKARQPLNLLSCALLLIPCFVLLRYAVDVRRSEARLEALARSSNGRGLVQPVAAPDIYYIILDSYTRPDMLERDYHLDVSAFVADLESLGFYVVPCSQSNYAFTGMSLASTMNLDYLDAFTDDYTPGKSAAFAVSAPYIRHSLIRRTLESLGYRTFAFETGWEFSQVTDADVYLAPPNAPGASASWLARLNDFERLYLSTTAAILLPDLSAYESMRTQTLNGAVSAYARPRQRARVLFALEELANLPAMPGPKFVFAHIVSPHYPFVLGPDGEAIDDREDTDARGYGDQVRYLNKRLIPILASIIDESPVPPIILIQGDHGTGGPERKTKILSAYLLPETGRRMLYPSISPVNSFRVVLNSVFGAELDLLPDRALFSYAKTIYEFIEIKDVGACAPR